MCCETGQEVASASVDVFVAETLIEVRRFGEQVWVYRSEMVRDTSELFQPVLCLVGEAEPVVRKWVDDPLMMFCRAEGLIYDRAQQRLFI